MKIGREPSRDLPRLLSILEPLTGLSTLLDGNRLLSLDQVLEVVSCLPQDCIEYVEEPLVDPGDCPSWPKLYQWPWTSRFMTPQPLVMRMKQGVGSCHKAHATGLA